MSNRIPKHLRPRWWLLVCPLPGSPIDSIDQLSHDLRVLKRDGRLMMECEDIRDATTTQPPDATAQAQPHAPATAQRASHTADGADEGAAPSRISQRTKNALQVLL